MLAGNADDDDDQQHHITCVAWAGQPHESQVRCRGRSHQIPNAANPTFISDVDPPR